LKCEPMQLSHVTAFWLRLAGNILLDLFLHVHTFCSPVARDYTTFNPFEPLPFSVTAALCLAESDDLVTPDKQTADFSYLRLRKEGYLPNNRAAISRRVRSLAQQFEVFTYYKQFDAPECSLRAEELLNSTKSN
jgi:hypothetical protein